MISSHLTESGCTVEGEAVLFNSWVENKVGFGALITCFFIEVGYGVRFDFGIATSCVYL